MKRYLAVALTAAAVVALAVAPVHAKRHGKHVSTVTAASAGQVCDPSHCTGSCPMKGVASAVAGSAAKMGASRGQACPVSDPSKCPPGCRPKAAGAVAAQVTQR